MKPGWDSDKQDAMLAGELAAAGPMLAARQVSEKLAAAAERAEPVARERAKLFWTLRRPGSFCHAFGMLRAARASSGTWTFSRCVSV
jgi:hypothetical protein